MTVPCAVVLAAALLLAPGGSFAHSVLLQASPAPDARLPGAPGELALRFNNRVEKKLSRVRLVDSEGGALVLAPGADGAPDRLVAPLPPLGPGRWRVEWQVLSADGHVVTGAYTFQVAP